MKTFDVKSSINPDTYQDEYLLTIKDNKRYSKHVFPAIIFIH